jgi:hypothetical protein
MVITLDSCPGEVHESGHPSDAVIALEHRDLRTLLGEFVGGGEPPSGPRR